MDGSYPVLQYGGDYKNICKFTEQLRQHDGLGDCYCKSQRVRLLPNLIKYLGTAPRIFLGTRSVEVGTLRRSLAADSDEDGKPITDIGCDDDDVDDSGPNDELEQIDNDDFGPIMPNVKRQRDEASTSNACKQIRRSESESSVKACDDNIPPTDFSRDAVQLKPDTNQDRLAKLLERLMIYLGEYDYESIIYAVGMLDSSDETNRQVKAVWNKLVCRAGTQPVIKRVRDKLKASSQAYSFEELCENFLDSLIALVT